ncbi:MAG: carboxymuconolactone decarboxylase family protein [Myxococcales bacterium]|nr:carboxymuconolactone decarboxylase family protein [Myxococcales bacterium]
MSAPRIRPGTAREIGFVNALVAKVLGLATGGKPPNVFTTLAKHRGLFRKWLVFAGGLMPGGTLRRAETELLILYVARHEGCDYEWAHHEKLGRRAGLTEEAIGRVGRLDVGAAEWSPRERAFLAAARDLLEQREIGDEAYAALEAVADEREIIELCLLVGHYLMLASTLKSLRVPLDE